MSNKIIINTKLPEYCRTTSNPRFKIVEVNTPEKWYPTYRQLIEILTALDECEKENVARGKRERLIQDKLNHGGEKWKHKNLK